MARRLRLTHFVDVTVANLSVVSAIIGCQCVLFVRNGQQGQQSAVDQLGLGSYPVALNWGHLLQMLLQP